MVQRYYSTAYATHEQVKELNKGEEFRIHQHHNGLCVLTLGPNHPILLNRLKVVKVDFNVGNSDRSKNAVRGKKKKGGLQVQYQTIICKLYTDASDDPPPCKKQKTEEGATDPVGPPTKQWNVYACIKGSLVEPNLSLIEHPELLETKVRYSWYILEDDVGVNILVGHM